MFGGEGVSEDIFLLVMGLRLTLRAFGFTGEPRFKLQRSVP